MGNKGEGNREAIAASMETEVDGGERKDLIRDANELVAALSEIKRLKAEQLETQDGTIDAELEVLSARVKASIEALRDTNLEAAQNLMARGYRESGFDPIDVHEMGFADSEKTELCAAMES
jgi:hypothetical protein